jgi:hypothetical protein
MSEGTLRTLEKMTRTKLVELAHKYPDIVGAVGMSKEQLVAALGAALKEAGEWVEGPAVEKPAKEKKEAVAKAEIKKELRGEKKKRAAAREAGDAAAVKRIRQKIHVLKGKLRRHKPLHHEQKKG